MPEQFDTRFCHETTYFVHIFIITVHLLIECVTPLLSSARKVNENLGQTNL